MNAAQRQQDGSPVTPPAGSSIALAPGTHWADAQRAAAVLALQPAWLGGVVLRASAGPVRDAWLALLRTALLAGAPLRKLPLHVQDDRLLGGLDLGASLQTGHTVAQRGLLAEADGGVVVLAMAERTSAATAARLAAVLDVGEVVVARDGVTQTHASRIGVVALDEGDADERPPAALTDRLAIWLDLTTLSTRDLAACNVPAADAAELALARQCLPAVSIDDAMWDALCTAAWAMGIVSMRAPLLAVRVARALAALDGRDAVDADDAALAARWVLGPRARTLPVLADDNATAPPPAERDGPPPPPEAAATEAPHDPTPSAPPAPTPPDPLLDPSVDTTTATPPAPEATAPLEETVLAAALATMPAHLLERFALQGAERAAPATSAGAGQARADLRRGAPVGVRRGDPRGGQRLNLLATLRAAVPWQRLRQPPPAVDGRPAPTFAAGASTSPRIHIRAEDFRVTRFVQRGQTTVIFVVDASGSSALHRLAEAKGAVELLLADCYARRDSVAVLAFRGQRADLLLPPTRSLVRAKRALAGLPGGGGTPLASAIDAAALLADQVRRNGQTPLTVLLTDGRANIARDGSPGRALAEAQALQAAHRLRASRLATMLLDTSPRPHPLARQLADAMGALYLALPQADAADVCAAVRGAMQQPGQPRPAPPTQPTQQWAGDAQRGSRPVRA